jgi:hypothetical protein
MNNIAICGIDCDKCNHKLKNKCNGCRANMGKIFWGECDLYTCCAGKNKNNCGKCDSFPCDKLKEWASGENPERIQNLFELNDRDNKKYSKLFDKDGRIKYWPNIKKKDERIFVLNYLQSKFEKGKFYTEMEINEILGKWHLFNDHALLRREMYDQYFINRTKDVRRYWIE